MVIALLLPKVQDIPRSYKRILVENRIDGEKFVIIFAPVIKMNQNENRNSLQQQTQPTFNPYPFEFRAYYFYGYA